VANKTIIEHNLDQLKGIIDEAIIIVSYRKEMITEALEDYAGLKITYVEQKEQLGTGHALIQAEKMLDGKFIVMNGDDMFSGLDIRRCMKKESCMLVQEREDFQNFGVVETDEKGFLTELKEKTKQSKSKLVNCGLYVLDKSIFAIKLKKSARGEYELTDYIKSLGNKVFCQRSEDYWFPIVHPWSLLDANSFMLEDIRMDIKGIKENNVTIKGNVILGERSSLLPGTFIEGNVIIGRNCKIGPNCYLRGNTSIGDNCHIGQAVEIKNSVIMDRSKVPHLSYIGDSVIGLDVNLGAGTITANLRHDNSNVKSAVKGDLVDTGRRKLGAIIGDNVHTGIHTSIYPGRKIWPGKSTLPGECVQRDIE